MDRYIRGTSGVEKLKIELSRVKIFARETFILFLHTLFRKEIVGNLCDVNLGFKKKGLF